MNTGCLLPVKAEPGKTVSRHKLFSKQQNMVRVNGRCYNPQQSVEKERPPAD
jgi:hypothetical protein